MNRFSLIVVALAVLCFGASASTIYQNALPTSNLNDAAGNARSNAAFGESDPFPSDGIFAALDGDTITLPSSASVNTVTTWMVASPALPWAPLNPLGNQALGLEMSSVSLWFRVDPGFGTGSWTQVATGSLDPSFDVSGNPNAVGSSNANIGVTNVTYSNGAGYEDANNPGSFFPLWQLSFSNLGLNLTAGVTYDFAVTGLGYAYPGGPAVPTACANDPSGGTDCQMNASTAYGYWYNSFSNGPLSGSPQDGADGAYLRCSYDVSGLPTSVACLASNPLTDGNWNKGADMNVQLDGAISTAPEPSTVALFVAGLAGLGFLRRRKR